MKYLKVALLIIVLGVAMLSLTGCGKKKSITTEDFKSKMEAKGFEVQDATNQFPEGSTKSVSIAVNENYQIEFYVVETEEQAISAYQENKHDFEELKSSGSVEVRNEISNHGKYSLTSNGKYMVISRIDNTFIYLKTDEQYKSEIKDILKELGY